METLISHPSGIQGDRLECQTGWFRLVFDGDGRSAPPEVSGFDSNIAPFRIARFQTSADRFHYAIFRGASFTEEAGDLPTAEALERSAYWNDCLLLSLDRSDRTWQILCNRAASIPAFWSSVDGQTRVSNDIAWLGGRSGQMDQVAFAETLLWDVPLGQRTLRTAVHQLPAGYKLLISPSGVRTQRAFVLNIRPPGSGNSQVASDHLVEQGASLNSRAVQRAVSQDQPLILPISGGLDSRCILGSVPSALLDRCSTISFGQPGAFEIRLGRAVANQCGVSWRSYTLNSSHYTNSDLPELVRAGCGMTPLQHLHLLSALRPYAKPPSQILIGFMGDPIAGADALEKSSATDPGSALSLMFQKSGFTRTAATELFGRQTVESIAGDIESIFSDATSENPAEAFLEYYFIVERQSKLVTHIFNHLHSSGHGLGFPFMDGAWARFYLSLPPALRANRSLFKAALSIQRPDLARIPSTSDFAPIAASRLRRASASLIARNWSRANTLAERITGYRCSLPNPFATEHQGVVLRGPLHRQLLLSIEKLRESGLISEPLAHCLRSRRSLQYPWIGFRAISAAHCIEEHTL